LSVFTVTDSEGVSQDHRCQCLKTHLYQWKYNSDFECLERENNLNVMGIIFKNIF